MKNKIILVLMAVVFAFISCSKNEGGINGNNGEIDPKASHIGTWEVTSIYTLSNGVYSRIFEYDPGEVICEVTANYYILNNSDPIGYSYDESKGLAYIFGDVHRVFKLTQTELEVEVFGYIQGLSMNVGNGKVCLRRIK